MSRTPASPTTQPATPVSHQSSFEDDPGPSPQQLGGRSQKTEIEARDRTGFFPWDRWLDPCYRIKLVLVMRLVPNMRRVLLLGGLLSAAPLLAAPAHAAPPPMASPEVARLEAECARLRTELERVNADVAALQRGD